MGSAIVYGTDETRSFCFISDAVDATISVANSFKTNQEIIHIGEQNGEIAINLFTKKFIDLIGLDVAIEKKAGRPNSVSRRCPDTQKLFDKTGFKGKVGITEGLPKTKKWYFKK